MSFRFSALGLPVVEGAMKAMRMQSQRNHGLNQ